MKQALLRPGKVAQYYQSIKSLFGHALIGYWTLGEIGGTVVRDVAHGLDGVLGTGEATPAIAQAGIGDGKTSFSFDGGDIVNIYSAGLNAAFNNSELTILTWIKMTADALSDGVQRYPLILRADISNQVNAFKHTDNKMYLQYSGGGTDKTTNFPVSHSGWFRLGLVVSKTGDYLRGYLNGTAQQLNTTELGTWAGALATTACTLGARNVTPQNPWLGSLAHVLVLNRAATSEEMMVDFRLAPGVKILSVLGDSIAANYDSWAHYVIRGYATTPLGLINHAVSGHLIISNMDAQTISAAGDLADIIIISLGTNDDNAGNMTTLQAEVEENIIELKASNPNAAIYYMNILPRWEDEAEGAEVDKSNLRTAIAAACTAQSITCWDTYTDPWIAQNQTADGLHPNAAGHAAIATRILALL